MPSRLLGSGRHTSIYQQGLLDWIGERATHLTGYVWFVVEQVDSPVPDWYPKGIQAGSLDIHEIASSKEGAERPSASR